MEQRQDFLKLTRPSFNTSPSVMILCFFRNANSLTNTLTLHTECTDHNNLNRRLQLTEKIHVWHNRKYTFFFVRSTGGSPYSERVTREIINIKYFFTMQTRYSDFIRIQVFHGIISSHKCSDTEYICKKGTAVLRRIRNLQIMSV